MSSSRALGVTICVALITVVALASAVLARTVMGEEARVVFVAIVYFVLG